MGGGTLPVPYSIRSPARAEVHLEGAERVEMASGHGPAGGVHGFAKCARPPTITGGMLRFGENLPEARLGRIFADEEVCALRRRGCSAEVASNRNLPSLGAKAALSNRRNSAFFSGYLGHKVVHSRPMWRTIGPPWWFRNAQPTP
jgi:hypothetical protein